MGGLKPTSISHTHTLVLSFISALFWLCVDVMVTHEYKRFMSACQLVYLTVSGGSVEAVYAMQGFHVADLAHTGLSN